MRLTNKKKDLQFHSTKKETKKAEILSAAMDLFAEKGFYSTRIKDITNRIDIAPGTFYLYFENKISIFTYIIDTYIQKIAKIFKKESPDLSGDLNSFKKQLERLGNELFELFIEDKRMFQIIFFEAIGSDEEIDKKMKEIIAFSNHFTERYLISGINKGFLKGYIDTSTAAQAINGMILTALSSMVEHESPYELKQKWINTISMFLIGGLS